MYCTVIKIYNVIFCRTNSNDLANLEELQRKEINFQPYTMAMRLLLGKIEIFQKLTYVLILSYFANLTYNEVKVFPVPAELGIFSGHN